MQDINTLTSLAVQSVASAQPQPNVSGSALFERVMDRLWERMTEIYGHKWTSAYGEIPVPGWETALRGISPERIKQGLEKMAADRKFLNWPPAALEFRALCLPSGEEFGLPTEEEALAQAVGNRTSKHPSVVLTLREMGELAFEMRRMEAGKARTLWSRWWLGTVDYVANGGELPEPEKKIERKDPGPATPEEIAIAKQAMGELKALFS